MSTSIDVSDERTPLIPNNQRRKPPHSHKHNQPQQAKNKKESFWKWLRRKHLNLGYFFITLFIPPLLGLYAIVGELDNAFIIAGLFGIFTSLYGLNHFRLLFKLKHEVDVYTRKNEEFKQQRIGIDNEIDKLSTAKTELKKTASSVHESNLKMNDLIRELDKMEEKLMKLGSETSVNLQGIGDKANKARKKYYDIAVREQKTMMMKLFNRLEHRGDKMGITKEDYEIFYKLVPKEYQQRFDRLGGFAAWLRVGDNDKDFVDIKDFEKGLEIYAEMHVRNVDIVFKIEKEKSVSQSQSEKKENEDEKGFVWDRKVTILSKTPRDSWYLTKESIWGVDEEHDDMPSPLKEEPGLHRKLPHLGE